MAMKYDRLVGSKREEGSIRNWVGNDKIPADFILQEALGMIYSRLRLREMLHLTSITIASAASSITLPQATTETFLEPLKVRITGTEQQELEHRSVEELLDQRRYNADGNLISAKPRYYAIIGTNIEFDTKADKQYTGDILYYAIPPDLSTSNQTNFLTDKYPRLIRMFTTALAAEWLQRPGANELLLKGYQELDRLNVLDDEAQYRDAHLQMQIGA